MGLIILFNLSKVKAKVNFFTNYIKNDLNLN